MPRPRKELVCTATTPYYHCVSRCVRRAYLCGEDRLTGQSYEHRRQWIVDRIHLLSTIFCIDVCAFAVMSNHYHIVLRINDASALDTDTVISRWLRLYQGPLLARRHLEGEGLSAAEQATLVDIVAVWRKRLGDLSWFMKCLNEPIARQANSEDQCKGHFWESRFKSQALHTRQALLACMAYVDLNPIRAGLAETPEASDYTSVQQRICSMLGPDNEVGVTRRTQNSDAAAKDPGEKPLLHFDDDNGAPNTTGIPFALHEYLALVDWTGRQVNPDKQGFIARNTPVILERLGVSQAQWRDDSGCFEAVFQRRFALKR
ncbi:MAG: REP element-mobilizing transposase RayT [Halieaceae bacterium]|jgi:REP element-mobilizing transposase RayT